MSAALWWEPKGADIPNRISLGRALSDLQKVPQTQARFARTLSGRRDTTRLTASTRIRVESAPINDYDLADRLEEMANYLRRGGLISLAEDQSKAWAYFASSAIAGSTLITLTNNPWDAYSSGNPTAGDRFTLHGPTPRLLKESHEVDSLTVIPGGLGIVSTQELRAEWDTEEHVLVREYGFWPILRMPEDAMNQAVLRHRHRRYWTLELTLETDEHAISTIAADPTVTFNGPTDVGDPTMLGYLRSVGGV